METKMDNIGDIFSRKSGHINESDMRRGSDFVDQIMSTSDIQGAPPPQRPRRTLKQISLQLMGRDTQKTNSNVESDAESGRRQHLSGGSHAVAKFLANKLYMGLKHPQQGRAFRDIIQKIMDDTRDGNENSTSSGSGAQQNGLLLQEQGDAEA